MIKAQASGNRVPEEFEALVRPHIDSYDYFIGDGMHVVVESIEPLEVSCYAYLSPPELVSLPEINLKAHKTLQCDQFGVWLSSNACSLQSYCMDIFLDKAWT